MKRKWKMAVRMFRYHGKIFAKGIFNMLFGTATAGAFGMAVYGFTLIPSEGGYTAVANFIMSVVTLIVAVTCVHSLGNGRRRK